MPQFDARLEDGTAVRVQLREMAVGRVGDEAYAVRLTTSGNGVTRYGYLAAGRLGSVLSVLRELGPAAVGPEQVASTLDRALDRAAARNLIAREWGGPGKMDPCRPCVSPSPR
ncbi:hypothetical protein Prum_060070 [Phytohabitans rumicis]|uniref:Uncharacterized protein n=1 Tax=Phytohabitans rumicis TaxID=1076125 RepID=A0A6V8LI86_9ACTN|nr:hypothetical protein Prum_060070 [Phytohabitans rumicis]